jgi:hypothetical protein
MDPITQKRLDEQVKYEAEQREKKKAKRESGFYDKDIYKSPKPMYQSSNSTDPLGRNLTEAEKFSKGFKGGAK